VSLPSEGSDEQDAVRASGEWRDGRQLLTIVAEGTEQEVYISGPPGPTERSEDAAAVLGLLAAMSAGAALEIGGPISPVLAANLEQAQRVLEAWNESLSRVPVITATREAAAADPDAGSATFFSGGVDSFYTLLEHRDRLTHLILVHGFDLSLGAERLRGAASAMARAVARRAGLELVEIETDLRRVIDPRLHWPMGHGFGLAAVGLCLQEQFATIRVPASYTYRDMFPWGTHPLLDPLWSTDATGFVHDGFGVDRFEKVERISESPLALEHLRVCWENRDGEYNCGRCEKCVRTMISLAAVGALDRCSTFSTPLRADAVSSLAIVDPAARAFARQNLQAMESRQIEPEIAAALRLALKRSIGLRGLPRRTAVRARYLRKRLAG
jgi:hypothetical protein